MTLTLAVTAIVAAVLLWPESACRAEGATARPAPPDGPPDGSSSEARETEECSPEEVAESLCLLAIALRSGAGPVEALECVSVHLQGPAGRLLAQVAAAHRWGLEPAVAWQLAPPVWRPAAVAWEIALAAGAAPADLVARAAEAVREREARRVEAALARASALLVLPLGLAFLPAFLLTTVIPVVLALGAGLL